MKTWLIKTFNITSRTLYTFIAVYVVYTVIKLAILFMLLKSVLP